MPQGVWCSEARSMWPVTLASLISSSTSPAALTNPLEDSRDATSNPGAELGVPAAMVMIFDPPRWWSWETDTGQLGPLGHQATGHVPDEARFIDPSGVDELCTLEHAYRAGRWQRPHVDRQFQGRHPTGELDV